MKTLTRIAALVSALALSGTSASAQVLAKKTLTLDGAKTVVAAAESFARSKGAGGSIAVVDDGGNLLLLERLDDTFAAAANVSVP